MAQDKVIIRRSGHQQLDELDATDIPDLSADYDAAGTATAQNSETENVHGIVDTAELTTASDVGTIVGTHAGASDPHADRSFATSAISTHAGAADPHTGYQLESGLAAAITATKLDDFAAPDDNTDLNVSTTKHGLTPKLPNDATKFLDGTGAYTVPPGTGLTNPMTTAADLIVGGTSGAPARLAKGADGTVLTVDPTTHLLVWTAPSGGATYATPAIVLGTAAAAGSAGTGIRSDATLLAFDATTPAAIGTAAVGAATVAPRRDHVHATGAGTPSTQAFGDAAATGTGPAASMTDHKHAMPATPIRTSTILAISGGTADGDIRSSNATYATANSGGTFVVDTTSTTRYAGQELLSAVYYCYQLYLVFDTSPIPDTAVILRAQLGLVANAIGGTASTAAIYNARLLDWGATVTSADWLGGAATAALPLLAHIGHAAVASTGYTWFISDLLAANIDKTANTRIVLASSRFESVTTVPGTGTEYVQWRTAEYPAALPQLVVEYIVP